MSGWVHEALCFIPLGVEQRLAISPHTTLAHRLHLPLPPPSTAYDTQPHPSFLDTRHCQGPRWFYSGPKGFEAPE